MRALTLAGVVLALTLAGCSDGDQTTTTTTATPTTTATGMVNHAPMTHNVSITGNAYVNATLDIRVGDKVAWTHNDGNTAHTVTSDDGGASFDSHPNCVGVGGIGVPLSQACMVNGDVVEYSFGKAGTVTYHCKVHEAMTGTINVTEHTA